MEKKSPNQEIKPSSSTRVNDDSKGLDGLKYQETNCRTQDWRFGETVSPGRGDEEMPTSYCCVCFLSSALLLHGVLLCDGSQFFNELGKDDGGVNLRPVQRNHNLWLD